MTKYPFYIVVLMLWSACSKTSNNGMAQTSPYFSLSSLKVDGVPNPNFTFYNTSYSPVIKLSFSTTISHASVINGLIIKDNNGAVVAVNYTYENNDSTVVIVPTSKLTALTKYIVTASAALQSQQGGNLQAGINASLITKIDSTSKFPAITDSALLDLVQRQTFKYFWDFGHPNCGMALERNTSGDVVTTGGTGFGTMAMIAATNRNFISRADAVARIQKIVSFLKNNCTTYHGAFSHWINGATGATVPFSTEDNGGDIVETAYLMEGLLCARQYFNQNIATEDTLRNNINALWNAVEWTWYQNNQNTLYWLWSPTNAWESNVQISGWNEALISYILAASSTNYAINKTVYDNGWARNGNMKNGKSFYGVQLPLGPDDGGPLFFEHYSFLGLNPNGLSDAYANYATQVQNHSLINHNYCKTNPNNFFGYSDTCWGLTASDILNGYTASSPTNDVGVIAPTAAISSLPYTPVQSMNALRFFYYTLGDKLWGQYGFYDAFSLKELWFANSYIAIDQGPQIVMIENYRTGLIWNLFMSCPEVRSGLTKLGFTF